MSELSPEAKKLFNIARDSYSPDADRVMATHAVLKARTGTGVHTSEAPPPAASSVFNPSVSSLWKLIGMGMVVAVGTGAVFVGSRYLSEENNRLPASVVTDSDPSHPAGLPKTSPGAQQISQPFVIEAKSTRTIKDIKGKGASSGQGSRQGSIVRRKPSEQSKRLSISEQVNDSLSGEIALLRKARAALDRRDAAEALAMLDRYKARYPMGTLQQEQLATRVLALCLQGRYSVARAFARELERTAPQSPHLARIRASCVAELDEPSANKQNLQGRKEETGR